MKRLPFLVVFISVFSWIGSKSQTLTVNELISWPRTDANIVEEQLTKRGWGYYFYEVNKDSGFVRRAWMIKNNYNDLTSYFQYYIFDTDTLENYIIYQFSDRDAFNSYKSDLKKMGYKLLKEKKKKKKKKDKDKYKNDEELYLSEKTYSLISIKEVFLLGFNVFLVNSYNSKSKVAKNILEEDK